MDGLDLDLDLDLGLIDIDLDRDLSITCPSIDVAWALPKLRGYRTSKSPWHRRVMVTAIRVSV